MSTATVNIPSQVSPHATLSAFPLIGVVKTIYIAEDTNAEYRWNGSAYVELSPAVMGVQSVTGDGVDNTDPDNPVLSFPTPGDIGAELASKKDATGGYAGLTLFKINFKNVANTFISFFTNANTAARTYTFKDADGTIAFTSDITGTNSNTNTGDNAANSNSNSYADGKVADAIVDGTTTVAPSQNAVFDALASLQSQLNDLSRPTARWYSDGSNVNPADASVQYFGTLNNVALATANTYQMTCTKTNAIYAISWGDFVSGTLGSAQGGTIMIHNLTQATSETLTSSHLSTKRVSASHMVSTLAFTVGDLFIVERTNPSWATNPTGVFSTIQINEY